MSSRKHTLLGGGGGGKTRAPFSFSSLALYNTKGRGVWGEEANPYSNPPSCPRPYPVSPLANPNTPARLSTPLETS